MIWPSWCSIFGHAVKFLKNLSLPDMEVGELSLPDVRKDSSNISNSDGSDRTILSNHTFCSMMTKKPLFSSQL